MHFGGLVILPLSFDGKPAEKLVSDLLALHRGYYDDPIRKIPDPLLIQRFADYFKTGSDVQLLAEKVQQTFQGRWAGADENGIYFKVDKGKWDGWSFYHGEWMLGKDNYEKCRVEYEQLPYPGRIECNICRVSDLLERDWYFLVTPDAEWHDYHECVFPYSKDIELNKVITAIWENHGEALLTAHAEHFAVGIDCHY